MSINDVSIFLGVFGGVFGIFAYYVDHTMKAYTDNMSAGFERLENDIEAVIKHTGSLQERLRKLELDMATNYVRKDDNPIKDLGKKLDRLQQALNKLS